MNLRRAAIALCLAAILAAGCSHLILGPDYSINVSNGTTIPVTLVLNEEPLTVVQPEGGVVVHAGDLPARPWTAILTTAGGRVLATLPVAEGSVVDERALDGTGSYSAPSSRTVLTCGDLWIQIGDTASSGGPAGAGPDGDCAP